MERPESIIEIAKALSKMQGTLKSVPKDSTNPFFKMRYASLDAIWDICRKPLTENGLCLVQTPKEDYRGKLYLETLLLHSSGEWIKAELPLNAKGQDPQSIGSAITYARRYSLSAMLGISADEDDDAEAATGRDKKPAPATPAPAAPKAPAAPAKPAPAAEPVAPKPFIFESEYTQPNIDKFKAARDELNLSSEQVQNILEVAGLKAWVQGGHTVDEAIAVMRKWAKTWAENEKKGS